MKDVFIDLQKNQFTVIFGGYKNEGFKKMEALRNYLRNKNYKKTFLVTDLPTPKEIEEKKLDYDQLIAEKSLHYAKKAQVALFLFFKKTPYGSAVIEMTERLSTHVKLAKCTSFFIENGFNLQIVERGFIKTKENYNVNYFDSKKDLHKMAEIYCFNHLLQDRCTEITML